MSTAPVEHRYTRDAATGEAVCLNCGKTRVMGGACVLYIHAANFADTLTRCGLPLVLPDNSRGAEHLLPIDSGIHPDVTCPRCLGRPAHKRTSDSIEAQAYRREHAAEEAVRAADAKVAAAIAERVTAGSAATVEALRSLVCFKPEDGFPIAKGYYDEKPEDIGDAPLVSETFLYALFGKEDARSILGRINSLCEAVGIANYHDLQTEMYEADALKEKEKQEREWRIDNNTRKAIAAKHTFKRDALCVGCNNYIDPDSKEPRCRHASLGSRVSRVKKLDAAWHKKTIEGALGVVESPCPFPGCNAPRRRYSPQMALCPNDHQTDAPPVTA